MTTRLPEDGEPGETVPALDEFVPEPRDVTAEPRQELAVSGTLLDLAPALAPLAESKALSRQESLEARRAKRRWARLRWFVSPTTTFRDWIVRMSAAVRSGASRSGGHALERTSSTMRGGTRAIRRTSTTLATAARTWTMDGTRAMAMPAMATTFEPQQPTVFAIAGLLAVCLVGYGTLVTLSWQQPLEPSTQPPRALDSRHERDTPPVMATRAVPDVPAPVARRAAFSPSPRTLTAMWQHRDTRSLDQAFSNLRHQTLAFHRCRMRMTDANRAVAHCEGVATAVENDGTEAARRATWTIAFTRNAGRWQITRVTMR